MSFSYLIKDIYKEKKWDILNPEQKNFCLSILSGKNVFLTGSAGTGKSYVLNFLFKFLSKNNINYGKTALSGIAALNINGSTIHSWSGIGLANTDMNDIFKMVFRNKKARARIENCSILFIDEISLCSGKLFRILDSVYKGVRRNKNPFGGIQICISGDFLQLPYIPSDLFTDDGFAFETDVWNKANFTNLELTEIVRQKDDKEFSKILNEIRYGDLSNIDKIKKRIKSKLDLPPGIRPIRLLGYNKSVETWNKKCLDSVEGKIYTFFSQDKGEERHIDFFNKNCPSPSILELKVGCQVILTYNINVDEGLVNGLLGKVIGIEENLPVVKFINGTKVIVSPEKWEIKEQFIKDEEIKYKIVACRTQIPLKLAYASSYHKAQGTTLDFVEIDLEQVFTDGMAYSALSRVKNLNGLSIIRDFNASKLIANKKCIDFYNTFKKS